MAEAIRQKPTDEPRKAGRPSVIKMHLGGAIRADDLAASLGLTKTQLADAAGIKRTTLAKHARQVGPRTQARLREMTEILARVEAWAGGEAQALSWYRAEPIPAFGGRTAEALVKEGRAAAVRDYLDHVALGGYA
jgi:hypothetical protein